jgi:NAD(P)-dependent dehydrogenase (short-subunit alcohol dehydrogenase family)
VSHIKVNLTGQVVFVTGGGSGIGRGVALQLARSGAAVVITDINGESAAAVAAEVKGLGRDSLSATLDVSDATATQVVADRAIRHFGRLDILFANAGVLGPADYMDITPADWDLVLDVNIKGVVHSCRAVVPHMIERKQGRILITSSYNGVRAGAHVIPYRVSKAAVLMYTRSLALLLAPHQITVNAICPGVTLTPMQLHYAEETATERGITTDQYLAERAARIPMQAFTEIDDLAGLVQFLVSDSARLITGQAIAPDGGVMTSS